MRNSMDRFTKSRKRGVKAGLLILMAALGVAGVFWYQAGKENDEGKEYLRPHVEDSRSPEQAQEEFNTLLQEFFVEEVTDDSITMNFRMKDPESYGIQQTEPALGSYSLADLRDSLIVSENRLATMETFDYEKLNEEQKLIYDILNQMLNQNLEASDFLEYSECLGPTSGIQAQLPVLLAEFNFYQKEDIDIYLQILKMVPNYFEEILAFEQMKSEQKLFMSDTTAQAIIDQCNNFIASPEENYLIAVFDQKVKAIKELSEEEIKKYSKRNKKAVLNYVVPAYEGLEKGLTDLLGTGVNEGGLCHFEKGTQYYTYLVKAMTGSNRSLDEIDKMLGNSLKVSQKKMAQIMSATPDSYYDAQNVTYPYSEPTEAVELLREQMLADFPALSEDITCDVKYVDESLEDSLSPAFYLASPMDAYEKNVIYINQSDRYDLSKAFPTIGHESYPGHLYQNCYFQSTNPNPIRSIINIGGYTEGWGTYAELYTYHLAGLEENVADLLEENTLATLCIYAKADMGVNYHGWSYKELNEFLEGFGFDSSQSKIIFDSMVAEPASYMQYTLGYLEIEGLLKEAEACLGNHFSLKEFHKFYLSIGTAPFSVISDRMKDWMENQKKSFW